MGTTVVDKKMHNLIFKFHALVYRKMKMWLNKEHTMNLHV